MEMWVNGRKWSSDRTNGKYEMIKASGNHSAGGMVLCMAKWKIRL